MADLSMRISGRNMARPALSQVRADIAKTNKSLKEATENVEDLGEETEKTKGALKGIGVAAGVTFAALSALAIKATVDFARFGHEVATVSTMVRENVDENTALLAKGVREISRTIPQGVSILNTALYDLLSASVPVNKSLKMLKQSGVAAVAGVSNVQTAANLATGTINALGMAFDEADKVFDVAFSTVRAGKVTFSELAGAMGQVLPAAAKMGSTIDEVYGSIAFLTKNAMDSAMASVSFARALDGLGQKAAKLKDMGVRVFGEKGEYLGIINVMEQIAKKMEGMTEEARVDLMKQMGFDIRAARAITVMATNLDAFRVTMAEVANSAGATEDAYKRMEKTLVNQWKVLKNNLKDLSIVMGETFAGPAVIFLNEFIKRLQALSDTQKRMVAWGTAIGIAFSGVTVAATALALILPKLAIAWATFATVATGPVGLGLVAVGAAVAGVTIALTHFSEKQKQATEDMREFRKAMIDAEIKKYTENLETAADKYESLSGRVEAHESTLAGFTKRLRELNQEFRDGKLTAREYVREADRIGKFADIQKDKIAALTKEMNSLDVETEDAGKAGAEAAAAALKIIEAEYEKVMSSEKELLDKQWEAEKKRLTELGVTDEGIRKAQIIHYKKYQDEIEADAKEKREREEREREKEREDEQRELAERDAFYAEMAEKDLARQQAMAERGAAIREAEQQKVKEDIEAFMEEQKEIREAAWEEEQQELMERDAFYAAMNEADLEKQQEMAERGAEIREEEAKERQETEKWVTDFINEQTEKRRKAEEAAIKDMEGTLAPFFDDMVAGMMGVEGAWESLMNRVKSMFIQMLSDMLAAQVASGLARLGLGVATGGWGAALGGIAPGELSLGLFGFDNPANDALAKAYGSSTAMMLGASFDNPRNDYKAKMAGAFRASTDLGQRSADDMLRNFQKGFTDRARATAGDGRAEADSETKDVLHELKKILSEPPSFNLQIDGRELHSVLERRNDRVRHRGDAY